MKKKREMDEKIKLIFESCLIEGEKELQALVIFEEKKFQQLDFQYDNTIFKILYKIYL